MEFLLLLALDYERAAEAMALNAISLEGWIRQDPDSSNRSAWEMTVRLDRQDAERYAAEAARLRGQMT